MPSPSKKPRAASALARFINSLRPDRRAGTTGSLPLQTGFPTSLADLYVKNQSRLKKPSKKSKKKRHVANSDCVLTPLDSTTDASIVPPDSICGGNVDKVVVEVERVASVPDDKVIVCPRRNFVGIWFVVIVNIVVLILLAIFGSKLILGFTALAFFLWFLDSMRLDLVQFFKPRSEMRPNLCCLEQRNFAVVSPIREVEIQTESESTEAEIGAELDHEPREIEEIWEEISDVWEVEPKNSKKKSILKRLLSKKGLKRKQQLVRDDELGLEESSVRSSKAKEREAASVNSEKEEEDEIVNLATETEEEIQDQEEQQQIMARETTIPSAQTIEEEEIKERISWWVVFPMVALFGLMEGKTIALLLTLFCFLSVSFIALARRNQRKHRTIRFTL